MRHAEGEAKLQQPIALDQNNGVFPNAPTCSYKHLRALAGKYLQSLQFNIIPINHGVSYP
jgi:hypothetical protein